MAGRIKAMRLALQEELHRRNAPGDWSFILKQKGMFSYTGLTQAQVRKVPHLPNGEEKGHLACLRFNQYASFAQCKILTEKHHVYLPADGRINMAGKIMIAGLWEARNAVQLR